MNAPGVVPESTTAPVILLLGGNRSNVPSIRAAKAAGFFTVVVDPHPDSPALREADSSLVMDVRNCDRLIEFVDKIGVVHGIVSMSEAGIEPAAQLSGRLGLRSISLAAAGNARSKARMRELWSGSGFSADYIVAETLEQALAAVDFLGLPLVFKPDRSFGGSRGVSRVQSRSEATQAFTFATQAGDPGTHVVVERCVTGSEHSCEVLIHDGNCFVLCIGQKLKSPYPYRVDTSVRYPAPLSSAQEKRVEEMCQRAISALGLTRGAAHVEFAMTATGPMLFEIGARAGGGHTPQIAHAVSGVDEFVEICRMACGLTPIQLAPIARCGGEYRFLIFPPGQICSVSVPEEVRSHSGVLDVDSLVRPGDILGPIRTVSDRAGFVVTRGNTLLDACELADWACKMIVATYTDGSTSTALIPCPDTEVQG